ncbi:MAG: hypothetical protein A2233_05580 [Candidatus Kerfeldbacteria bacterium RIFOXYA2_FULL_38_24]|uniref:Uncharacterized protein n=1 Tax=Candidatus Kerfeldbacteria bacterium RIFOXYB2_FULL_38_14 TaxID=1798547 RepID=A0A1G2BGV4_9BACT|nr:MAG: hypothetical protein A2233_05580 [Candidatus Kerfeldbacteria bacterium RIFOXYA2_FULL_38_24]OGY88295.1 MAG: hypothetical protein A2319_03865 [Candidatus Kerfeldbacteria bacterium RIFOXYB2_FULL_38_14]OGY89731.1 MAG: hypothetical protein A2458_01565 [Candidatus Kerfeldbacteria bacterium RIFOXYC2_FULL_38_9]
MTLTTHAATGIMITQWTNNILAGFIVAVISHYVIDTLPHGDEFIHLRHVHNRKDAFALTVASLDLFLLILLLLSLLHFKPDISHALLAVAVVGSILPDIFITLYTKNLEKFRTVYSGFFQKITKNYHRFLKLHYSFHMFWHTLVYTPIRFSTGLMLQFCFIIFFVYYFVI